MASSAAQVRRRTDEPVSNGPLSSTPDSDGLDNKSRGGNLGRPGSQHRFTHAARGPWPSALRALHWLVLSLLILSVTPAHAQDPSAPAEPGARGTIGGLVLGAELVMLTEAAFGVRPVWAYAVGGGAGAVAGAIGGFASDEAGNTSLSMGFLVGALVLAVPTTMAVLSATSYHAPAITTQASRFTYKGTRALPNALHVSRHPTSFLAEYDGQSLAIRVPDVKLSHVYSRLELSTRRAPDATQVLVPIFRMSF